MGVRRGKGKNSLAGKGYLAQGKGVPEGSQSDSVVGMGRLLGQVGGPGTEEEGTWDSVGTPGWTEQDKARHWRFCWLDKAAVRQSQTAGAAEQMALGEHSVGWDPLLVGTDTAGIVVRPFRRVAIVIVN